ncbi:MAG: aspartate aminotransferase family protein [Acidobacteriota bacterium]|nr:aspartate aminotransferase family protein [Acidobacteriota bacterium]
MNILMSSYDNNMSMHPVVLEDAPSEADAASVKTEEIRNLERDYLLQNYARYPVVLHRGKGSYVYDIAGQRYLDLITGIGVNALGYAHPRITKVMKDQAGLILHTSNLYFHEYQGRLAQRLAKASGLGRVFFCNSGTEGMEGAIKMIHSHGRKISSEKNEIISLENSFHGRTMGALSITGQEKYRRDFEPLLSGIKFVPRNDLTALEQMVSERTAGIVVEWIQGEGGIYSMSAEYARKARELADRYNALLVFDEIQCGVGRTGTYFAYQLDQPVVLPDVMVVAKPMGCGLPLGAIVTNDKAAAAIGPGMHGSTFGGGPLACRVALEFFDILDGLLPSIQQLGAYFRQRLEELKRHHHFIKEVRGQGLMIGVELDIPGKQFVLDALEQGMLINCTHDVVLRFLPPYTITEREIDQAISKLAKIFKKNKPGTS